MSGGELDRDLERLRAATEEISPDERIGDAILSAVKGAAPTEDPLARLARATAEIDASPEIGDAIMARIARVEVAPAEVSSEERGRVIAMEAARRASRERSRPAPASWAEGVGRAGPFAVAIGLVAAAASFLFFLSSQQQADNAVVSSVDTVEVLE